MHEVRWRGWCQVITHILLMSVLLRLSTLDTQYHMYFVKQYPETMGKKDFSRKVKRADASQSYWECLKRSCQWFLTFWNVSDLNFLHLLPNLLFLLYLEESHSLCRHLPPALVSWTDQTFPSRLSKRSAHLISGPRCVSQTNSFWEKWETLYTRSFKTAQIKTELIDGVRGNKKLKLPRPKSLDFLEGSQFRSFSDTMHDGQLSPCMEPDKTTM